MRALITGGSGYLGRQISQAFVSAGWEVVNFDLAEPAITFGQEKDEWVRGDLLDTPLLTTCLQCYPPDLVLHTALYREAPSSLQAADKAASLNVEGTRSLLWSMASVGCQRLIALTGARVYGFSSQPYLAEDEKLSPQGKIGESLKAAEEMMLEFQEGLPGYLAILRLFAAYGYLDSQFFKHFAHPEKDELLGHVHQWKRGEVSQLFGKEFSTRDGTFVRDFMHIRNITQVVLEASSYIEHEPRLVCNLGLGKGYSQLDVLKLLEQTFSLSAKVAVKDRRPEEPPRLVANAEYLAAWSGQEFLPLKEGLKLLEEQGSVHTDPQSVQCHPHQSTPPFEAQRISGSCR